MPDEGQFELEAFRQAKQYAAELEKNRVELNKVYKRQDDIYWMRWEEESSVAAQIKNVKVTKTPRGRNAHIGARRLLTAADPLFAVPKDINNEEVVGIGSELEKFAKAMWMASGYIQGNPTHYDVVHSGLLYSEIHIAISSTKDIVKNAKGSNPANEARAEYVQEMTPYLFECWNPQDGYPDYGTLGLQAFYRRVKMRAGELIDKYGEAAKEALLRSTATNLVADGRINPYAEVDVSALWTLKDILIWITQSPRPIKQEEHGLPFIPIVAQGVEGSKLFTKPEEQHEPFLWTLNESGLLSRQNLILTLLYTLAFGFGNPMWVNYLLDPDNPPDPDFSVPGGQINMRAGERREPALKQVIDPALMQAWQLATDLEMESTIYRQTLGEPLGANAPYSMVALLAQGGRLPLTMPQRKSGWAIAEAVSKALKWMRFEQSPKAYARFGNVVSSLSGKDVPKHFSITCSLEITLPQDRLNAANAASVLTQGDSPLTSRAWVQENVLNIGQPEDMQQEIWKEKVSDLFYQQYVYKQMATLAQLEQMAMQPGAAGGMPGAQQPGLPYQPPGQTSQEQAPTIPAVEPQAPYPPAPPLQPPPQGGEEMV